MRKKKREENVHYITRETVEKCRAAGISKSEIAVLVRRHFGTEAVFVEEPPAELDVKVAGPVPIGAKHVCAGCGADCWTMDTCPPGVTIQCMRCVIGGVPERN